MCGVSVDKCADLQPLWEGHFTALWFFIQAFQTAVGSAQSYSRFWISQFKAGLPGQAVGEKLAPALGEAHATGMGAGDCREVLCFHHTAWEAQYFGYLYENGKKSLRLFFARTGHVLNENMCC